MVRENKQKNVTRDKERITERLCNICPPIRQRMLDNLLTDEEETRANRTMILPKYAENNMDRTSEQQGRFRDDENQKDIYT